jgi:hypothetical protein
VRTLALPLAALAACVDGPPDVPDAATPPAPVAERCAAARDLDGTDYLACDRRVSAEAARAVCADAGMVLAGAGSPSEARFLHELAADALTGNPRLGGDDMLAEGVWRWADSLERIEGGWAPGQPDGGAAHNCLALLVDGAHAGRWFDAACDIPAPFVCERSAAPPPEAP